MAAKMPKDLMISRRDLYVCNPFELVVDETAYNTRWQPVSDEKVRELAISIIDHGQLEPVLIRCIYGTGADRKYTLAAGFTRSRAIQLINTDPELRERANLEDDAVYPIACIISNGNATDSLIKSIVENAQRNNTSYIDDAYNHEKMRELGYTNADIARLLNTHASRVSQLKRLLMLSDEHKLMVHQGEIPLDVALRLCDLPENERDNLITKDGTEEDIPKADLTTEVKKAQRKRGKKVGRSVKELKAFIADCTNETISYGEKDTTVKLLLGSMQQFMAGEIDDTAFIETIIDNVREK